MNKITKITLVATTLLTTANANAKEDIAKFMTKNSKISVKDNNYASKVIELNGITCVKEFWKKGIDPAFKIIDRKSCKIILFKTNGVKCINIQPK